MQSKKILIQFKILILLTLGSISFSLLSGCVSPGAGTIPDPSVIFHFKKASPLFQNTTVPFSYPSGTRRDLFNILKEHEIIEFEVEGKSSAFILIIPTSFQGGFDPRSGIKIEFSDRGINQAIADAKKRYQFDYLTDIRIDLHLKSYFHIYNKLTTVIHAKGIKIKRSSDIPDQKGKIITMQSPQ